MLTVTTVGNVNIGIPVLPVRRGCFFGVVFRSDCPEQYQTSPNVTHSSRCVPVQPAVHVAVMVTARPRQPAAQSATRSNRTDRQPKKEQHISRRNTFKRCVSREILAREMKESKTKILGGKGQGQYRKVLYRLEERLPGPVFRVHQRDLHGIPPPPPAECRLLSQTPGKQCR